MSQDQNPELVPITTVDGMAIAITAWNKKQVALLNHMQEVPAGTDMHFGDETIKLEGDTLKGFKVGLAIGLELLGKLPFQVIVEEDDSDSGS